MSAVDIKRRSANKHGLVAILAAPSGHCAEHYNDQYHLLTALVDSDRGRAVLTARKPVIYAEHIAGDAIPGEIPRHPFTASFSHCLQRLARHRHRMPQGRREGLDAMIDPPAAAFALKPAPWRPFGRDHRRSCSKRLRDRETEVLVQGRENENVGALVSGGFRLAVDRAFYGNAGEAKGCRQRA